MSDLIVPGDTQIVGTCLVCGERFFAGGEEAWQRHVGRCARSHLDEIRQQRLEARMPIFAPWDPEAEQALADGAGKRMREAVDTLGLERAKRDGHMEVKPREKAG